MKAVYNKTTAILLAGGTGSRMNAPIPKQFILLKDKLIALHSFSLFLSMPEIQEVVVVCAPEYRRHFKGGEAKPVVFALPGRRRQDSVLNGLQAVSSGPDYICIHDAARPFVTHAMVQRVLEAAFEHGAASAGMPIKFTIKEHDGSEFVKSTPDRSNFWEIQTPQAIRMQLILEGFGKLDGEREVTDDVSLVEIMDLPVKLVRGSYQNVKITTQEDLDFAKHIAG